MKIKKIVVSILSAVFITSTLVGCGSNTTSTESSTSNNSNGEVVTYVQSVLQRAVSKSSRTSKTSVLHGSCIFYKQRNRGD